MRDDLPRKSHKIESGVINLDNHDGRGTHWVAYYKRNNIVYYFDSFGDLRPPKDLLSYLGGNSKILYNYNKFQTYNSVNCGHLCLEFLKTCIGKYE